jgi:PhnB protein
MDMENKTKVPEGYQTVMPYLLVEKAASFFKFLQVVFGARQKFMEMKDADHIRHGEAEIGGSVIMFADATAEYPPCTCNFFMYVADVELTFQAALLQGCTEVSPVREQSYGRSGGVKDPFGNTWWITTAI